MDICTYIRKSFILMGMIVFNKSTDYIDEFVEQGECQEPHS